MASTLFRNIGTLISGDIRKPLLEASSVYVEGGVIREIGTEPQADTVVDVRGATLTPGLWDAHHHPYFGEYTPRVDASGAMTRTVRAGTTAVVSAGPAHQPGIYLPSEALPMAQAQSSRAAMGATSPRDALAAKALAIVTAKSWRTERPMGIKCYAETVIAEPGFSSEDFAELAEAGVRRIKFLRPVPSIKECENYCQWAHDRGMLTMTHTGGRKLIEETESIGESLRVLRPDVACHINGGPTPPAPQDVDWLIRETSCVLDLVLIGNLHVARQVLESVCERNELHRVVIGTDTPSNSGVYPGGVLRMITLLSNVTGCHPEQLICMATGNTARNFGLPGGLIEPGQPADLVVWDAVDGSYTDEMLECIAYGDKPAPGLIMIDGEVRLHGDPRATGPKRMPTVTSR